jgi:HECT-like Ubiquitin-conjugating enzyme (E2)-binding
VRTGFEYADSLHVQQSNLLADQGIARVYSEWHDNLGLAVIMIWSDHSEMKVPVIESITSERVTVCLSEPLRRVDVLSAGHCSFANSDGQFTGQGTSTQPYKINVKCQATAASVQTQHTLVRIKHLHAMYCHACKHQLVQLSSPVRLAPMPADGWEEMLDAWMCHDDQAMNQHILRGKAVMAGQESTASSMIFVSDLWLHITKACFMSAQRPGVICQVSSDLPRWREYQGSKKASTAEIPPQCDIPVTLTRTII